METIRVLGEIKKSWIDGNLYPVRQKESFERYRDSLPPDGTPIQIEISPADAPTREELIEALTDYVEEHRHQGLCYGLDKGVRDQAESLLSRCEEADHE